MPVDASHNSIRGPQNPPSNGETRERSQSGYLSWGLAQAGLPALSALRTRNKNAGRRSLTYLPPFRIQGSVEDLCAFDWALITGEVLGRPNQLD